MTLKPSYLSFSAAKRLALFSPLLCLLLLTACAPQQSGLQHHQYSIVRYQDSLTACMTIAPRHAKRFPTRPAANSRQPAPPSARTVPTSASLPSPMKNSTTATLKSRRNCSRNRRSTGSFAHPAHQGNYPGHVVLRPPQASRQTQALMHAGVDIAGNRGEKVVASAPGKVVYSGRKGSYGLTIDIDAGKGVTLRYAHLDKLGVRKGRRSSKASISAISAGPGGLRALTCTLKCGSAISRSIRCSSSRTNTSGHQTQEPNSANASGNL